MAEGIKELLNSSIDMESICHMPGTGAVLVPEEIRGPDNINLGM
jgi:hypothetical protein